MIPFIDIHTHFRTNVPDVISVLNFTQNDNWEDIVLADFNTLKHYSIGLHPWFVTVENAEIDFNKISKIIDNQRVIAVGECGLDKLRGEFLELQKLVFERQIRLAEQYKKPILIHCVKAFNEVIAVKKRLRPRVPMVIHGFNQNENILKELLKNDFYISIGTNVLIESSNAFNAISHIPLTHLFLETDDKKADIKQVYEQVAAILNMPLEELKVIIFNNFNRILTPI